MSRVLLVDDHPVVRAGYQRLLEQDGEFSVVAQAGDVNTAIALFDQHRPDLTVTDLSMPGSGGLELIRRLRERGGPGIRSLVFSMHDSEMLVRRALQLGACGYVSKSAEPDCLLSALRCVMAGGRYLSPGLPEGLLDSPGASSIGTQVDTLTPRELEIFRLLASGTTLADCARALHVSPKTVANHQSTIKEKLGLSTSAAMAHLALRYGLIPGR